MIQTAVGEHHRGQARQTREAPEPSWYNPALLAKALSAKPPGPLAAVTSEHLEFPEFEVYATERGERDVVLQFLEVKVPKFEELIAEAIEAHFGTTEGFSLHQEESIKSYGLLMSGVRGRPGFSHKIYVSDLLALLVTAARTMKG